MFLEVEDEGAFVLVIDLFLEGMFGEGSQCEPIFCADQHQDIGDAIDVLVETDSIFEILHIDFAGVCNF